jgi:hypothetical protein
VVLSFFALLVLFFALFFSFLVTRDRMGRMNTFMARILKDIDNNPPSLSRAVGIDEHTALLLDPRTGDLSTVGVGTAYVCDSNSPATVCKSEAPLTFQGLCCCCFSFCSSSLNSIFLYLVFCHLIQSILSVFLCLSFFFLLFCCLFLFQSGLNCIRLNAKTNDKYSFAKFKGDGVSYVSNIVNGQYTNTPYGPTPSTA